MKIVYLLSAIILMCCTQMTLHAAPDNNPVVDSLLKELSKVKNDTVKVKLLNSISKKYLQYDNNNGIEYGKKALKLAEELNWRKGISLSAKILGYNYHSKAIYYNALECYFKAQKADEYLKDTFELATDARNIAVIYALQKKYEKALEYSIIALEFNKKTGDSESEYYILVNIGYIYKNWTKYADAIIYMNKALRYAELKNDSSKIARSIIDIGEVYILQKKYKEGLDNFFSVKNSINHLSSTELVVIFYKDIGDAFIALINDKTFDKKQIKNTDYPVTQSGQIKMAIDYLENALFLANNSRRLFEHKMKIYNSLAQAYSVKGNYANAYNYVEKYLSLKDSINSQQNNEKVLSIFMQRDFELQRLADSITADRDKQAIQQKMKRQRNYLYVGIAIGTLLLFFTFFIVRERSRSEKERKRSNELLHNILPEEVADELKDRGATTAQQFDNVTVLFTDFVNFTTAGERMGSQALVEELHNCFKAFDEIMDKYGIEKIKTIGDAYLAVCGLPTADEQHAEKVVNAAQEIRDFMKGRHHELGDRTFEIRIGIHSGEVVAGIVGVKKFAYDIWGDTVNTASRMESNSEPGKINISETTYNIVSDKFTCTYRGELEAKNKGKLRMYFVS